MKEFKVLNISQPFAHEVVWGDKNVENRTQNAKYRGTILIYASKTKRKDNFEDSEYKSSDCAFGAIVGVADLVDCIGEDEVTDSSDEHFSGPYGLILENRKGFETPIKVSPPKGAVKWWTLSGDHAEECLKQMKGREIIPLTSSDKVPNIVKYKPSEKLAVIIGDEPLTMREALFEFADYLDEFNIEFNRDTGVIIADKYLEAAFSMKKIELKCFQELIKSNSEKVIC